MVSLPLRRRTGIVLLHQKGSAAKQKTRMDTAAEKYRERKSNPLPIT